MKRILLIVFVISAWCSHAQLIQSFGDFHSLTEDQATIVFGSVNAYNMEAGLEYNSSHHRLVMLIGARLWWLQEIPHYMAEKLGCSKNVDSDNDPIHSHFKVYPGGVLDHDDDKSPVDIVCTYDDSLRIQKVRLTGNTHLLVKLFLWYWENSDVKFDADKMKKGCLFYENCGSDRICFNWKGARPNIIITKNPTFQTPLPTIAERS